MSLQDAVTHPNATFLDEDICLIKDFLPEELAVKLLEVVNTTPAEDWNKVIKPGSGQWQSSVLPFDGEVAKEVSKLTEAIFKDKPYTLRCEFIRRRLPGAGLIVHHDNLVDASVEYGLVYYLDDDYVGGEIYYPHRNVEYKPVKNSLVIHSATEPYAHGVKEVSAGTRHFITMWAYYGNRQLGLR